MVDKNDIKNLSGYCLINSNRLLHRLLSMWASIKKQMVHIHLAFIIRVSLLLAAKVVFHTFSTHLNHRKYNVSSLTGEKWWNNIVGLLIFSLDRKEDEEMNALSMDKWEGPFPVRKDWKRERERERDKERKRDIG